MDIDGASGPTETTLLFLHGVGTGDPGDLWRNQLDLTLRRLGYPTLDDSAVIAPKYAHALKGFDGKTTIPPVTITQPGREAARRNRREFERRVGALEFRLGRHHRGGGTLGGQVVIDTALALPAFVQARNYVSNEQIRANVLRRILEALPDRGRLVIVAHSLGSVIAADVLRRLPTALEVAGLVTIGSPLASARFEVDKLRDALKEPPTNLSWWVNFWNRHDPVSASRGVSSVFPWLIDFRIDSLPSIHVHDAVQYLADDAVGAAVGYALFGSQSKEVERAHTAVDIPLDVAERYAVVALRYASLIRNRLDGDVGDRYSGALRYVQATAIDNIMQRNEQTRRPTPSAVARLAFDLADPDAPTPASLPTSHIAKDDAVVLFTVLASENILRPFEITIPQDKQQSALRDLAAEMDLGSQFGADVFEAAKRSREVLSGSKVAANLIKWGAIGAGAAALVAATGGLALAVAPGVVGAAVVTTALASFGPGGMIGGLITAGTLVSAGGGGIAFGLASPGASAETVETVVARQLAAVILRELQGLEQDPAVWHNLVEIESEVRREYERLDEFSDDNAAGMRELKRKLAAAERALAYMRGRGLEPGALIDDEEDLSA
ncbi:alpha/beta hydrolase [Microbacterium sp. KSW4-4]|uniref:alpha/beta hydrolase n=1 Tax=Microbacterium sp. KSW4-4 TaxID=2851651 RepID=UPI001FFD941F|nr:alpha/beta hydrolase [Microbacterium sp. KSW4-4]MCK2033488.1 alpha/beta hydrolase [Microbacterium sp. KSW4-4]